MTTARSCARSTSDPSRRLSEVNYFFALSKYADRLLALYEAEPTFVQPDSARNEVISFVRQGLQDLSISRSTFDWGIPVPWDEKHVFYVWIDALLNYATAAGFGTDPERFARIWPADVQLVGKDILRFHAVIWPAMLMAAGVDVPRRVFAHGWLQVGGQKMSKSKATAIHPSEIVDTFGSDAYRYYFTRTISFGSDGSFSWEHMSAVYTSELANGLGNLASRVTAMVGKYFDGVLPEPGEAGSRRAGAGRRAVPQPPARPTTRSSGSRSTRRWVRWPTSWGWSTATSPSRSRGRWPRTTARPASARLATILYAAAESLRGVAVLHHAVMPRTAAALWAALGADAIGPLADQRIADGRDVGPAARGSRVDQGRVAVPPDRHGGDRDRERCSMSGPLRARAGEGEAGRRDVTRPPLPDPLPSPVVDNHCHLDIADGDGWLEPAEALRWSAEVGVPRIVQIGCDLPGARWAVETATAYDAIVAGVAIHPNEAPRLEADGGFDAALVEIEELVTSSPRVRAVGETGLDYYRTGPEGVDAQRRSFAAHIALAHRHGEDAGDPRPRCARRRAGDARRARGAGADRAALLLG